MLVDGDHVLRRTRRGARDLSDPLAGLPPRWQRCLLGALAKVPALPLARVFTKLLVVLEFERDRGSLRGIELPSPDRREQHERDLLCWRDHSHVDLLPAEVFGRTQPRPPVEHDVCFRHVERHLQTTRLEIEAERAVLAFRHFGHETRVGVEPELRQRTQVRLLGRRAHLFRLSARYSNVSVTLSGWRGDELPTLGHSRPRPRTPAQRMGCAGRGSSRRTRAIGGRKHSTAGRVRTR